MRPLSLPRRLLLVLALLAGASAHAQPVDGACPPEPSSAAAALASDVGAAASAVAALPPGPVPDFSPMAGIVVHATSRNVAGGFAPRLATALGDRAAFSEFDYQGRSGWTDPNMVWMRDYHPLYVRRADGSLKVVRYLTLNPRRQMFDGSSYVPVPPPSPDVKLYRRPGEREGGRWLAHEKLPVVLEAGNLVTTGRHVFVTEKVLEDNAKTWRDMPHLTGNGYVPRTREQVIAELARVLEVPAESVVVVPSLPGEKTKHVDLWLMPLSQDEVMVPEIRDEAIAAIGYGHEIELAGKAKRFLDERSAALEAQGYRVTRLPMMPAVYLSRSGPPGVPLAALPSPPDWAGSYYSPANALLADVAGTKRVFLPTWNPSGFPEPYRALNERYADEWKAAFASRGWTPEAVDATELGRHSGFFRCISFPIPE